MKVLVAIDSFKGSFTSKEAAEIVTKELVDADIQSDSVVVADGGEGTSTAYLENRPSAIKISTRVHDPLNRMVSVNYAFDPRKLVAVIDSAAASGLQFVKKDQSYANPFETTSIGTGEMIMNAALIHGATTIMVGLGGTGITDAGIGMLTALGCKFFDRNNSELSGKSGSLEKVNRIDLKTRLPKNVQLIFCNDVSGPLTGATGAVQMFGPQKGVLKEMIPQFESMFKKFAEVVDPMNHGTKSGDGAAGGLGFAFRMLGAKRVSGFNFVSQISSLEKKIMNTNLVITGEGKLDDQSFYGKVPVDIARLSQKYHKPCIGVFGSIEEVSLKDAQDIGFTTMLTLIQRSENLEEAIQYGKSNLQTITQRLVPLFKMI